MISKLPATTLAFSVLTITLSLNTHAGPLAVYVPDNSCANDTVGHRIVYRVKEDLRRSTNMKAADQYQEAAITLRIVCLDPNPGQNGNSSQYSYSITLFNKSGYYDYFLTSGVGQCGSSRVSDCAESLMATIDSAVTELKTHLQDGSFNPFGK